MSTLDEILGIKQKAKPEEEEKEKEAEESEWLAVEAKKNPIRECKFTWPFEAFWNE